MPAIRPIRGGKAARMIDRVASLTGVGLVAICCAASLVALSLPVAGLGAWLTGVSLTVLPSAIAGLGLVAWVRARATREITMSKESVKP